MWSCSVLRLFANFLCSGNTKLSTVNHGLAHDSRIEECRILLNKLQLEYGQAYVQECIDLWRLVDILSLQNAEEVPSCFLNGLVYLMIKGDKI